MKIYNSREEVEEKYKWDLTDFFKNEEDFNKSLKKVKNNIKKLSKYTGCTNDSNLIYEFLKLEIETISIWEDLYVYSYLINDQMLGVKENIERKNKVELLNLELEKSINFFQPELLKLSNKEYNNLFKNNKLLEYKPILDKMYREKEHVLTEKEENIISSLINSMNHFDDMSSTLLNNCHDYGNIKIDDKEITIAPNNYRHLMHNNSSDIRHEIRDKFQDKLDEYSTMNALFLNSYISMQESIANIRGFKSSWDRKMFNWNMSTDIFRTLVNTVENNLDSLQKYYKLKKKVLNLMELTPYDLYLELNKSNKEYSIEEAQEIVLNSVLPLGSIYQDKMKKIFDNRYIDYCQYKGKCSGGYSFSTMNNNSRILMSYNGLLECISTIAHEGGHNVHHQFILENNPLEYREASSIIAEVASLTNECLLSSYLANNGKTKEEKLSGISNILEVIVSNLFGAVREGKIEEEMYNTIKNGGMITKEYMDKLSLDSLKKYYGNSVKIDNKLKNSWVNRSHYYMNYYLYSYAICISVACYIANKILKGDKDILNKYLLFLKTGSDKWPIEIYNVLGIDLNSSKVYEEAIDYFNSMINLYEKIYNE